MAEQLRWYAGPAAHQLAPILFTERCLNDALILTSSLSDAEARRIVDRLAPHGGPSRSRLLPALEADDLVRADLADYRRLDAVLGLQRPRRTSLPPRP